MTPLIDAAATRHPLQIADRPPEVIEAASRVWQATEDAVRGERLVREARATLTPHIVVNRSSKEVLRTFRRDSWFRTRWDEVHVRSGATGGGNRARAEVGRGLYGSGELAGRTVYGTVQFTPVRRFTSAAGQRVTLPNDGWKSYGDMALVVDPSAAWRATFTGADSMDGSWATVGALEQFDKVLYQHVHKDLGLPLERMSDANAIRHIRSALTRPPTGFGLHYLEVQLRGLRPEQIVEMRPTRLDARMAPDYLLTTAQHRDSLERIAHKRGITWVSMPTVGSEILYVNGRYA